MRARDLVVLALLVPLPALGEGVTVEGTVRFEGAPPKLPRHSVKGHPACGADRGSEALVLGAGQGVQNAVAYLVGVAGATKPAPVAAVLDQKSCTYVPHVQAVPVGSTLELRSSDQVLHNVHGYREGGATIFNIALPLPSLKVKKPLNHTGLSSFRCDAGHTWMSAYVWTFDHPYYAVSDGAGKFAIKDVPPGKYTLKVWHEGWKGKAGGSAIETEAVTVEQPVVVEAGKPTSLTVTLK